MEQSHKRLACVVIAACLASPPMSFAQGPPPQMPRPGAPMPPRDTSARPEREVPQVGTASISGRVVAADTGQPLRRATVTAMASRPPTGARGATLPGPRGVSARTDDEGRFTIRALPAGEYSLAARRSGYVETGFGQLGPRTPPRRITLAEGAAIGPLEFQLARGGVITGRVVDDVGEPAERVSVRLMRQQRIRGQLRLVPVGQGATTDDLGQYRLFGLAAGEYVVVAEPSTRMQFGPPSEVQGVQIDVIPTYGPGTVNPAEAQRVQVQAALETAMDVQLVAATVAAVRGRVVTSRGEPLTGGFVRLQSEGPDSYSGMGGGGPVHADGSFELRGVAPGAYTLVAQGPMRNMGGGVSDMQMASLEAGTLPVSVQGEDLSVVITTGPGSTAKGHLIVEGDVSGLAGRELRVVASSAAGAQMMTVPPARGRVTPDLALEIAGLRGVQVLNLLSLPEGWWIKEVRVGGQDALLGFDFGAGRAFTDVEIVVSARATGLAGTVTLPTGSAAEDYTVVLFPEDEERWALTGPATAVRMTRPDLDGRFTLGGVRPGAYYVLAVPAAQAEFSILQDPDAMRELAARARTVEIREGEMSPLTLTLVAR